MSIQYYYTKVQSLNDNFLYIYSKPLCNAVSFWINNHLKGNFYFVTDFLSELILAAFETDWFFVEIIIQLVRLNKTKFIIFWWSGARKNAQRQLTTFLSR
jgi:hypothetical protein